MTNPLTSSAPRLRLVLSIALVLLIALGGAIIVLGVGYLREYAQTVNSVVADAASSSDRIDQTKQDIAEYKQNEDTVKLAEQVIAQRESYKYQDDAYRDLLVIAARAGVSIEKYTFSDTDPAKGATSSTKSSNPATPSQTSSSSGFKPTYITVTLTNPVNYGNFLNFIHYIEQNLTKMQIKKISLSSAFGEAIDDAVLTDELTIEVYTQ